MNYKTCRPSLVRRFVLVVLVVLIVSTVTALLTALSSHAAFALHTQSEEAKPAPINQETVRVDLAPYILYYTDQSTVKVLDEVLLIPVSEFQHYKNPYATEDFGLTSAAVWLAFSLQNRSTSPISVILEMSYPILDKFDLYYSLDEASYTAILGGNIRPQMQKQTILNIDTVEIELPADALTHFYVRSQSDLPLFTPLILYAKKDYLGVLAWRKMLEGLFLGIMVVLLFYNIYISWNTGDTCYHYLTAFTFFSIIYYASGLGYFDFIAPGAELSNRYSYILSAILLVPLGAQLVRVFIDSPSRFPKSDLLFKIIIVASLLIGIPAAFFLSYRITAHYIVQPLGMLLIVLSTRACFLAVKQGYRPAVIYIWATIAPVSAGVLAILFQSGLIDNVSGNIMLIPLIAGTIQLVLFSFGLSDRINLLKSQAELSQQEVIKASSESMAKSQFLAQLSHEIRTPMNGVIGMTALLSDTPLSVLQHNYIELIQQSSQRLLDTINNILDYSKIEAKKLVLDETNFSPEKAFENCFNTFDFRFAKKKVDLLCVVSPDCPNSLTADSGKISQIIRNLISNSLKYTDSGYILLAVDFKKTRKRGLQGYLRITLTDTGRGITPTEKEKLFASIYLADTSPSKPSEGTGLGLTITQEIVKFIGGQLKLDSEVGKGTTVIVTIPCNKSEKFSITTSVAPTIATTLKITFDNKRVLLISGSAVYRKEFAAYFEHFSLHTTTVQSLPTIVSLIREGKLKNMLYDAIIVDLQSPTPEAEKILLTLEQVLREQSTSLILLIEANAKDREISLHTSYSLVEKNQSFINIRALLNQEINGVVSTMQDLSQDFSFAGLNILVAEDDTVNQMVIQSMLHKLGANTFIVEDGEKALQSYKTAAEMYDIILMDCELPVRNGFDTTLAIRQFESSHKLARKPIIALTAHNDVQVLRNTLKCGMDDHLTKPLNLDSLTETLLAYVKKI